MVPFEFFDKALRIPTSKALPRLARFFEVMKLPVAMTDLPSISPEKKHLMELCVVKLIVPKVTYSLLLQLMAMLPLLSLMMELYQMMTTVAMMRKFLVKSL